MLDDSQTSHICQKIQEGYPACDVSKVNLGLFIHAGAYAQRLLIRCRMPF